MACHARRTAGQQGGIGDLSSGWSELPADVLVTVLEALPIDDLCRAGAVCRWWKAASSRARAHHRVLSRPKTTPCLLYTATTTAVGDPPPSDPAAAAGMLYSITDGHSYPVPLNGASIPGVSWLGASHGWLVTADEKHAELHLVNSVTGAELVDPLPSVATIEQVRRVHHRAFISSDPSDGGDCVVVLIVWPHYHLCFARPGDAHWTWIPENMECCDVGFDGDGRTLYAMRYDGAIHAFDLHGWPELEREVVLRPQIGVVRQRTTNYLVHAPWLGCWLQVWRYMNALAADGDDPAAVASGDRPWKTGWIKVCRVDLAAQTLVEIKDLGDHALFVGCNNSFALAATDCPGILPNHVYYTDNEEQYVLDAPQCPRDIGMYNVADGSFHEIQPPCPWLNWPLPSWIMPSLA